MANARIVNKHKYVLAKTVKTEGIAQILNHTSMMKEIQSNVQIAAILDILTTGWIGIMNAINYKRVNN